MRGSARSRATSPFRPGMSQRPVRVGSGLDEVPAGRGERATSQIDTPEFAATCLKISKDVRIAHSRRGRSCPSVIDMPTDLRRPPPGPSSRRHATPSPICGDRWPPGPIATCAARGPTPPRPRCRAAPSTRGPPRISPTRTRISSGSGASRRGQRATRRLDARAAPRRTHRGPRQRHLLVARRHRAALVRGQHRAVRRSPRPHQVTSHSRASIQQAAVQNSTRISALAPRGRGTEHRRSRRHGAGSDDPDADQRDRQNPRAFRVTSGRRSARCRTGSRRPSAPDRCRRWCG